MKAGVPETSQRLSSGIPGLDDILGGGLPEHRLYVVQGTPGVGKTTFALQFLQAGAAAGESVLYISLSETEAEILEVARSHGWSLEGVHLYELSMAERALRLSEENTLYETAEVELKETMRELLAHAESVHATRIVFDSLSEIRLLAQSAVRYRRQLLSLKQYFAGRSCTVLLLDDLTGDVDMQVESLAHGVLAMEQLAIAYGADRRRLRVKKLRGATFRSGYHDFVVRTGGLQVFPRLVAAEHRTSDLPPPISTGVAGLDALLGSGLDRAAATLLLGPAGAGKSIIATQVLSAAAGANHRSAAFLFEERVSTFLTRATSLGLDVARPISSGLVELHQIDPAELTPDELTQRIRDAVVEREVKVIIIDSVSGYLSSMPDTRHLELHLHELLAFLSEAGVATVLTMAQTGLVWATAAPMDVSYLADNVVLFRYFEAFGAIKKAISVVKRRRGPHEDTIRELSFGKGGVRIGEPLRGFRGVLTGVPTVLDLDAKGRAREPSGAD